MFPGSPLCRSSVSPPSLGSRRRAPDSEPGPSCGQRERACKFKCEPQPPIIIISLYRQRCRGGALARGEEGSQALREPPCNFQSSRSCWEQESPQRLPLRCGAPRPRPGPARPPPRGSPRPPDPERGPAARCGGTGPSELTRSPPERGRRVREKHCSPIRQLTGKRMERPPPPWLPKPVEMGKVTRTEMPFPSLPPQSQRRLQRKNKLVLVPNFPC